MNQRESGFRNWNATRVIASTVGVLFGLFSGVNHGIFEVLQGNTPTGGVFIHAIGEGQRFWPLGTEDAFTLIPNFMITGILSIVVGTAVVVWSIWYLPGKHGRKVFLGLFLLLFLVGGGIGMAFFFLPTWAFATQMDSPRTGWKRILPRAAWPVLSAAWPALLALATVVLLVGLEMAVFGFFPGLTDPEVINSTAFGFVLTSALLIAAAFVAGYGHDLLRMESSERPVERGGAPC
jgi:hypothetical protein